MKKQPKHPGALPLSDEGSADSMHSSERGPQEDYYLWEYRIKASQQSSRQDSVVKWPLIETKKLFTEI